MSLAQRSVRSVTWTTVTTLIALPINLIQTILLARLLPVEYFGIFAGVTALINLSGTLSEFGLTNAFLHRSPETEDEDRALSGFFTLRMLFETAWAGVLLLIGWISFSGLRFYVLAVMVFITYLIKLTLAPRALLVRRVEHRRLAVLDFMAGILSAVVSVSIAFLTSSIWALMVSSLITFIVVYMGLYIWRPVWKPRLLWEGNVRRYYLSFGSRNVVNSILESALDNLDNLWTNFYLGDLLLGFYSRAFKFATYSRVALSTPVNSVIVGAYAELKFDRSRLSRAFFQTNAFLIRAGFLIAGWLVVIAPQFIRLLIGEKWLPMLDAFRLMLVFCMLDPIKVAISSVFVAKGVPEKVTRVRLVQLAVLVAGLFAFGSLWQISGVALAMDLMVIVGTGLLLVMAREHVDVSYRRLFLAPLAALTAGLGLSSLALRMVAQPASDWLLALVGTVVICLVYLAVLFLLEGKDILVSIGELMEVSTIWQRLRVMFQRYIYPRHVRYTALKLAGLSEEKPQKLALLSYIVHPFSIPRDDPRFYRHINIWHAQEMARALNRMGYLVDVVDYRDQGFKPEKSYDLFIGHGGINFSQIAGELPAATSKIYFATGCHWRFHNQQEAARFMDLERRRGISLALDRQIKWDEEQALRLADGIIGIGNQATRATYAGYLNVLMVDGTSLADHVFDMGSRDYDACRSNFLYFASQGNVHKGLDLLLEAFTGLEQQLWVAAPLEREFDRIYRAELGSTPNIHRVGWLQPRSDCFYELMRRCGFCILPSCSEGQSQSVIEAMHFGLAPIVSRMSGVDIDGLGYWIDPVTIAEIRRVVRQASQLDVAEYRELSSRARQVVESRYTEEAFARNFQTAVEQIIEEYQIAHSH